MQITKMRSLFAVGLLTLAGISNIASAAVVTSITGLDVGGTLYNVTFNYDISFNDLWDFDEDGVFGESDSSVFNTAPTFWNDRNGAEAAADAIIAYLGTTDGTTVDSDSFRVAYADYRTIGNIADGNLVFATDRLVALDTEQRGVENAALNGFLSDRPYASFQTVVPVPPAVWLFCSGLLGLVGMARRRIRD